jgi:hypothetical protein
MNGTAEKKGMSTGAKVGIGCGVGCLVVIILGIAASAIGWFFVQKKIDEAETELRGYGFDKTQAGQVIDVKDEITEKTLFKGQVVRVYGNSKTDIALLAQMAEIHGTIEGKVYFRGQILMVHPNGVIKGGVDAKGQAIQNMGRIEGEITGSIPVMDSGSAPAPVMNSPSAPVPVEQQATATDQ